MISFSIESIQQSAIARPEGYVEDCMKTGRLSDDGLSLSFTFDEYAALVKKYRGHEPRRRQLTEEAPEQRGPGTELKKLLKTWLRVEATPTCACNARAKTMDENEARDPGWCAANIETIVGWLREEATKRKLPFIDAAGRLLVRRAIRNAKKKNA